MTIKEFAMLLVFIAFITACSLLARHASAGSLTPYVSLGAYHRDCQLSDPMICDNDKMGSDTPGTIDIGWRLRGCGWRCLGADQVDIGWHHQSYVDRGDLWPIQKDNGPEAQIDMFGARFTWEIDSLEVVW